MKTTHSRLILALALLLATLLPGCGGDTPDALIASAKQYLAKGDRKAAVIQLKNALQKSPNLPEARFLLGNAQVDSGEPISAEKELRKALELGYPVEQVAPPLAHAMVQIGQFRKAVDEFGKVSVSTPAGTADLQTSLGDAQLALGNREAAATAFAAALTAQADYPRALLGQARMKAIAGDIEAATLLVDKAVAKAPKLTEGWQLKGDMLKAQNQNEAAAAAYRTAVETSASHLPGHFALIGLYLSDGKVDDAVRQLDALKKIAAKHPQTLYLTALVAQRRGNLPAAREAIQQHLAVQPGSLPGLMLAAAIDFDLGSYVQAQANLDKVLQQSPNLVYPRRLLIATYLRAGQPRKALEAAKPVMGRIDKDPILLALVGEALLQSGQPKEAARYFEKAAVLDPASVRNKAAMALSHIAGGSVQQGQRELEAVVASDTGTTADLVLIQMAMRNRDYDKALAASTAFEKKLPQSPIPANVRGTVLMAQRDVAEARKSFERAAELDPSYLPAAANLASLDMAEKKPDDAKKKRFEAVLAKDPKNTRALLALAEISARSGGKPDEVTALIERAIASAPTDVSARMALINYYLGTKNPRKALTAAQDANAALPNNPTLLDALARAQVAAGDANQAVATINKLVALQPNSAATLLRLAETQSAAKDRTGAMQSLQKALVIDPTLYQAKRGMASLELEAGRVPEALAIARDMQKSRPKEPGGYVLEGDIHATRKAWKEAVAAYQAGARQAGTTELAVKTTATLGANGQAAEADKFAAAWIKDHPKDNAFRMYLAERALARKDYDQAFKEYQALLLVEPNNATILNNMAWTASQLKDPKAIDYAERANAIAPGQPAFMDTLGMLLVDKGDTTRGIELLRKASSLAPQAYGIRFNLARALIKTGQKEAAKKELDELAKLGDKFAGQAAVAEMMKGL